MRFVRGTMCAALVAAFAVTAVYAAKSYKQTHRNMITDVAEGRADKAAAAARKFLEKNPGDLESHFVLACAHTVQGDLKKAMAHVKAAVEGGMPIGRFLAGPRDLLKPLVESNAFKALAKGQAPALIHGPMVGSVTDSSARFWVRTAEEADVEV
ncbi:MAG: hypothetical protein U9R68_09270, partial [Planctomycetota bacterium]|nr:hypothetical protein [Planctomycetota bacterium]